MPTPPARHHARPSSVRVLALVLTGFAALQVVGSAQQQAGSTLTTLATYLGPDRMQKLIAGAKKEGALNIYTSAQQSDFGQITAAFEKKYGIKTTIYRTGSENIVQRTVEEQRAGRYTVDIDRKSTRLNSSHT